MLGLAHHHRDGHCHATLTGGTKGSADQVVECLLLVGVGQDDGVVLGAHHALHALAGLAGAVVNVGTDAGGANKGHGLDVGVVADGIDHFLAAVHHI